MKDIETLDTTVEEWQAAMEAELTGENIPGKTARELAEDFNCSISAIYRRLDRMVRSGRCKRMRARRIISNGRSISVAVFQPIPKEEKK